MERKSARFKKNPVLSGNQTRGQYKEQRREEKHKCKLAVCAIVEQLSGGQGYPIRGTGFLVRDLFPELERKIHLVTSTDVICSDNLKGYYLSFKDSDSTDRDRELLELARVVNAPDKLPDFTSGLKIIPLDPRAVKKICSFFKSWSCLVTHRPFNVYKKGIQDQTTRLYCQVVEQDGKSYVLRPYEVTNENGQLFLTDGDSRFKSYPEFCGPQSIRRPRGAPITTDVDGKAVAVGVLTSRDDQISILLFSQLRLTCSGE